MNESITSVQNPKVKEAVRLRDKRVRDKTGRFLIEGYRELLAATKSAIELETLFVCPEFFLGENENALIDATKKKPLVCSQKVFEKLSYRDRPDGLLAVAKQMKKNLASLPVHNRAFYLIAEAIEKPGNLGTILRSSDAAGADGVIVCDRCTDIYNPNVVRSSIGTLFTQPVIEASSEETIAFLRKNNVQIVAATPSADQLFTEVDLKGPVAIAVGTEQLGLSKKWMEEADIRVRIPMLGVANSLNVATATTLLLYEVVRQR